MDGNITHVMLQLTPKDIEEIRGIYEVFTGNPPETLEDHLHGFCNLLLKYAIDDWKQKNL